MQKFWLYGQLVKFKTGTSINAPFMLLEPCPMCAGAIVQHGWVFWFGADDPAGAIRTVANIPDSACSITAYLY